MITRLRALETLDPAARARAEADVRSLGTNALPAILHLLEARHSIVERGLNQLADYLPWFPFAPKPATDRHQAALLACLVLGPDAAPAIPALSALLVDFPSFHIAMALAAIGPAALPAVCEKLAEPGEDTRYFAMIALRHLAHQHATRLAHSETRLIVEPFARQLPVNAVPALVRNLVSPDFRLRATAAWALGETRADAPSVIPALRLALEDPEHIVRLCAREALERIATPRLSASSNASPLVR